MEYLERMKAIQDSILEFLNNEDESYFEELSKLLNNQIHLNDADEFKSILHLISKIAQNHYRITFFFDKITKIFDVLKTHIKQTFSNSEIFNIFKKNKRILLLLIDEGILTVDSSISKDISEYGDYFYPETQAASNDEETKELPDHFEEKRRIGENDSYVCELIRNDNVEEFIINSNQNLFSLTMKIEPSIFETNSFLIKRNPTLIEYSMFFGSIQIFQFLCMNDAVLKPDSWLYAIHGKNADIIHTLEDRKILPKDQTFNECLKESIKCHHNDIAYYFKNNLLKEEEQEEEQQKKDEDKYRNNEALFGFHFYNFAFFPDDLNDLIYFFYAVDFDYLKLVKFCQNKTGLYINKFVIFLVLFY